MLLLVLFPSGAGFAGSIPADTVTRKATADVLLVEDHSECLTAIAEREIRNATVLHVDAHDDLWPAPAGSRVKQANAFLSSGDLESLREAGRFYHGRRDSLFNINNYLAMAHRLGLVKEVLWAYPALGSPDREGLANLRERIRGLNKLPQREVDNLVISPPFLKGTLSGVPVTIGSLKDLSPPTGYVLDVDMDFFPHIYRNPVSGSYLGILSSFVESVRAKAATPALTVISFSHNGGYLPISLRFTGRWLHELSVHSALLSVAPPKPWILKEEALYQMFFLQFRDAARLYRKILELREDDPDASYGLGMALVSEGDHGGSMAALEKAFRSDPAYILGFIDAETVASKREGAGDAPKYLTIAERLAPENPVLLDALGNFWYGAARYEKSASYYKRLIALGHATPLTHAYLGDSLALSGDRSGAESQYRLAIRLQDESPDTLLPEEYRRDPGEILRNLIRKSESRTTH